MKLLPILILATLAQILPVDKTPSWSMQVGVATCGAGANDVVYSDVGGCRTTACYFDDATLLILNCTGHKLQCKMFSASENGRTKIDDCPVEDFAF